MRLLLVDDDDDTRDLLSSCLERSDLTVDTRADLNTAKNALLTYPYAVLVTDLSLPDGEGLELLSQGRPPTLKLAVVLSGSDSEADKLRSRAAGFDLHATKPLDQPWFEQILKDLRFAE